MRAMTWRKWVGPSFVSLALMVPWLASAQTAPMTEATAQVTASPAQPMAAQVLTVPLAANYTIKARGANQRVLQKAVPMSTNRLGQVKYRTNSVIELNTGLHHLVN